MEPPIYLVDLYDVKHFFHMETNFEIGSLPSTMRIETHKWARQIGAWINGYRSKGPLRRV